MKVKELIEKLQAFNEEDNIHVFEHGDEGGYDLKYWEILIAGFREKKDDFKEVEVGHYSIATECTNVEHEDEVIQGICTG